MWLLHAGNFPSARCGPLFYVPDLSRNLITGESIIDNTGQIDRANRGALRFVEMPQALGAFFWVDDEYAILFAYRHVRTFRFACGTAGTLGSNNFISHDFSLTIITIVHAAEM